MLPPEERNGPGVYDPMCEVFPKFAACRYHRYGMGGNIETRSAICILALNMINDKVFVLIWIWFCVLVFIGSLRVVTRSFQLSSSKVRYFLISMKLGHFIKANTHKKHVMHYINSCSLGDWFVLYQLSKNVNNRFFGEFLTLVALTINPDPSIQLSEPEICLSQTDIDIFKSGVLIKDNVSESENTEDSGTNKDKGFHNIEGIDTELDIGLNAGGGDGLTGKERMLIKQGKSAKSAQRDSMKAQQAARRMKRK